MKVKGILVFILMAGFIVSSAGPADGKSAYLCSEHHRKQYDAWNINPDGTLTFQATYSLQYARDPAGAAIWVDPTDPQNALLFITSEFSSGIEMVDPITLTYHGVSTGPSNLAGIDVDDLQNIVYSVRRRSDDLYIYDLDPLAKTLTERTKIDLPGCSGAYGIALDEITGILWVGDGWAGTARAYDVSTWTEDTSLSFQPSHNPIDIAVDRQRGIVYTVSMSYGAGGMPTPSNLLSKFDLATRTETMVDLGHQGVGIAVDEVKGFVYVTGAPPYDNLEVWNTSTTPWTQVQATGDVGNPAGIAIGNVSYNPLSLAKNDVVVGYGVYIGQTFTYEITCENTDTVYDKTGVTMVDDLPVELDFVSETKDGAPGTGMYDSPTHTVTWYIGTIPAGQAGPLVELVVRVNQYATPDTTIYNYCTIWSDQGDTTTVIGDDPDNPDPDPGTPILPTLPVVLDIKPQSCPNPFNTKSKGVLPVAILGTEDFDATTVDPATVLLEGVAPLRDSLEDVSRPVDPREDICDCTADTGDGYLDMTLKFDHREILAALEPVSDGEVRVLTLTGMTYDGMPIEGQDCVVIIKKGPSSKPSGETPNVFSLRNNYPNPFNPATSISFNLANPANWSLKIYNVAGRLVRTFEGYSSGQTSVVWNGKDNSGNEVASGIYFYTLNAGHFTATKKMVLTK